MKKTKKHYIYIYIWWTKYIVMLILINDNSRDKVISFPSTLLTQFSSTSTPFVCVKRINAKPTEASSIKCTNMKTFI